MESRISVKIDFDNKNIPILQIIQKPSEDTRDEILQSFLQSLQHSSRWLVIQYAGEVGTDGHQWKITPVTPDEVPKELLLMKAFAGEIPPLTNGEVENKLKQ